MADAPPGLAAALRSALDGSGLSVAEISAETRIRATIVQDLVEGRTESAHGDVYVRGHLRAIAHATGTDPAPLLSAYERQTGARLGTPDLEHTVQLHHQTAGSLALPLAEKPERRGPRWGLALVAAAALLVAVLVGGSALGLGGTDRAEAVGAASPTTPPPTTAPPTTPPAPRVGGAALQVRVAGGSSWVQVMRGTEKLFEGTLDAGAVRGFRDPTSLSVRVGNAGAVRLTCAGRGALAGAAGQVRAFRCAPGGLSPV